ncbi:ATP-grasp domain-containing protein [Streptomyces sp. NPDC048606]|uniref:ATP-grasp domain-containing protein n=1 Tax=Streptomyces sp. NPDC048606 TaxID=3154726 RepID=UPI0034440004
MSQGDTPPAITAPRIAVIAGTPQLIRAARTLGVDTVLVHEAGQPAPACAAEAGDVLATDLSDPDALHAVLLRVHINRPFHRLLSLTEAGLLPAAKAAERLGVPGNPPSTVLLLRDKRRMRALLNERGLSPVRTTAPRDWRDLAAFCRTTGGAVILKPASGSGSEAVLRVAAPRDAQRAWTDFTRAGGTDPVAEEYLEGPEVSVETFTHAREHAVIAVTDKTTWPSFVEAGHTMPSRLPAADRDAVTALVRAFLDTVGLWEGPAHTEVKITPTGPKIIESHNRIGGDKIRELIRRSYGLDLPALTVGCPLGLLPPPPTDPVPVAGAAIRFLSPEPGLVRRITLPGGLRADDVVRVGARIGDRIRPLRDSDDRCGYVLATGEDATEAARRADTLRMGVLIEMEA